MGFDGAPYDYVETVDKGHGRVERRECWVITDPDCLNYVDPQGQWPQLKAAVRVAGHRQTAEGRTSQPRYYISSLAGSAEQLLAAVRSHWSIENSLHWSLDVTFSGRPVPSAQGSRSAKHERTAADRTQPAEKRKNLESGHPGQTAQRRMGRGLPAQSPSRIRCDCPVRAVFRCAASIHCVILTVGCTASRLPPRRRRK